jgi:SAM-dependent methyltransferase
MKPLTFRQFLEVGRDKWRTQRHLLLQHYMRDYRFLFQDRRKSWVARRNLLLRDYVRGPLGIHRRIRQARLINAIRALDLPPDADILDAGCGHGYATMWLARMRPDCRFRALEADPDLVVAGKRTATAMGLKNVAFYQGDVAALQDVAAYDLIFSADVLEHIEDDVGTLRAFRRALRPGRPLLLHLPRRHQEHRRVFPAFKRHTTPDHVRDEYTAEEITERLDRAGFRVEDLRYGFSLWGELAFELNNLFWERRLLRLAIAFVLHPLCVLLAYVDTRRDYDDGNSLLVLARAKREVDDRLPRQHDPVVG